MTNCIYKNLVKRASTQLAMSSNRPTVNIFYLVNCIDKDHFVNVAKNEKAQELFSYKYLKLEETLSGFSSFSSDDMTAIDCDLWFCDKLADFLYAFSKNQNFITLHLARKILSTASFWVEECIKEGFCLDRYIDNYYPVSTSETIQDEAIKFNPIFWAIFIVLHNATPSISVPKIIKPFRKYLFDTMFIYKASGKLYRKELERLKSIRKLSPDFYDALDEVA